MKKRQVRYPATVAFRTTNEMKDRLETKAANENKTVSEVLQGFIRKGFVSDFSRIYFFLVSWLASIRGKDEEWIKNKINLHHDFMIEDAHHGYNETSAIMNIKEEIQAYLELASKKALAKDG